MRAAVLNQVGDTKLELRDDVRTVEVGGTGTFAEELIGCGGVGAAPTVRSAWDNARRGGTLEEINDGLQEPRTGGTLIRQIVTFG